MKAIILETHNKKVTLSLKSGKDISVPKEKLKFQYSVGDTVNISKKGGEFIFIPEKKKNKTLLWVIITICAILIGVGLYFPISTAINNKTKPAVPVSKTEAQNNNKIPEPAEKDPTVVLYECLSDADEKYRVSDEDINASYSDNNILIANLTKIAQWYEAQANCYENAEGDYSDKISELRTKKAEVEATLNSIAGANNYSVPEDPPSNNYYVPTPTEDIPTTPEISCDDYHAQYYADYSSEVASINSYYNSAITNAHNSCGSFGGCPAASNLERDKNYALRQARLTYKSNMQAVGCDPSLYVDF